MNFIQKIKSDINQFESDIKKLKEEVGLVRREKRGGSWGVPFFDYSSSPLIEKFESLRDDVKELTKEFDALLKHFDIEYVEITEKNGGTKVIEKYRKRRKVKKGKKSRDDYEDKEDDDDDIF